MARIINTQEMPHDLSLDELEWAYNALDCCITREVFDVVNKQLTPESRSMYLHKRVMQKPALKMMLRGILIDESERQRLAIEHKAIELKLERWINRIAEVWWGQGLNPRSPAQLKVLLYEHMKLPTQYKSDKGVKRVTTDREALENLQVYTHALPLIRALMSYRDNRKKMEVLTAELTSGGRLHANFNIVGTKNMRWSSSAGAFGSGVNFQNITEEMRRIFISDAGFKLCYADLEQAESRAVAYLSQDPEYILACESGDLHTTVARMVWPEFHWTGDLGKDKDLAEAPYYRHFSRRDLSKRLGHGSNYIGKPYSLAKILRIEQRVVEEFQDSYFDRFNRIRSWHSDTAREIQTTGFLIVPGCNFRRTFFGRLYDDATLREAVACQPQAIISYILELGIKRLYYELDQDGYFELLGQVHDAVLFQYQEQHLELVHKAVDLLTVSLPIHDRNLVIPVEAKVGYSWYKPHMSKPGEDVQQIRATGNLLEAVIH